jgi:S-adenosylmethionine uptake transporter
VALGTAVPAYGAYVTAPPSMAVLAFTMVIGLCSILGSLLVSRAFMLAPAAVIAPVHYTQILWGLCFGAALFGEFPDGWTLLGAGVIIFAGLLLVRFSRPV